MTSSLGMGKRDLNAENHWKELPLDGSYQFDHPVLLVLGGNSTIDSRAANGNAKLISQFLNISEALNVDIVSAYYNLPEDDYSLATFSLLNGTAGLNREKALISTTKHRCKDDSISNLDEALKRRKEIEPENFEPNYIKQLSTIFFEPLISKDGKKISIEDAKKNLRNVTILAHCHGAYVTLALEEILEKRMKEIGYKEEECAEIQKQLAVVAIAPHTAVGRSKSTTVNFSSFGDDKFSEGLSDKTINRFIWTTNSFDKILHGNIALPLSGHETLYYSFVEEPMFAGTDQTYHALNAYTSLSKLEDKDQRQVSYVAKANLEAFLSNSIENAEKKEFIEIPTWKDLQTDTPCVSSDKDRMDHQAFTEAAIIALGRGAEIWKAFQQRINPRDEKQRTTLLNKLKQSFEK